MCVNLSRVCRICDANGETLRAKAYDNTVPSPNVGRCNDYEFVTQYCRYWYAVGSAHHLNEVEDIV